MKVPASSLRPVAAFVVKYFLAVVCTTALPLSVLLVGWTQRLAQRAVVKRWHRQADTGSAARSFAEFCAADPVTAPLQRWPNWIIRQHGAALPASGPRHLAAQALQSLWWNLRIGVETVLNTWVLTGPAVMLWAFAWWAGWVNSFHKGYEQSAVAPGLGILGVALYTAAMLYVPMAQARQAVTGRWRSFYEWRLVWRLVRQRWWASAALAALTSVLSLPVAVARILPAFFSQLPWLREPYEAMTDAQTLRWLDGYYFWFGWVLVALLVILRLAAARVYAGSLLGALHAGAIGVERLGQLERGVLERLDLLRAPAPAPRHPIVRAAAWTASRAGRALAFAVVVAAWLAFVAQIFMGQFFNYQPVIGWLNQPLVHLPWVAYIPFGLKGG